MSLVTSCEGLSPIACDICLVVIHDYRNFVGHFVKHQIEATRRCHICLQECIGDMRQNIILQGHVSPNVPELVM